MLHHDDRTLGYIIQARQDSLAESMAAGHRHSVIVSRFGGFLISIGERLRNDCPAPEDILAMSRRSRTRPSLT